MPGKTFMRGGGAIPALRRKKVICLVPLKALAEEKFEDFTRAKYRDYEIDVVVYTRDHREYDAQLEDGAFSIAVVVFEKLSNSSCADPNASRK